MSKQPSSSADNLDELCAKVAAFIDDVVIPREDPRIAQDVQALDLVTAELRTQARQAGVYAPQLPAQWGGLGLNWEACAEVFELAGRSLLGPLALNCAPPDQPNMLTLLALGSEQQLQRYLRPLAEGSKRACFAMTEPPPGTGSDPAMLQTRAKRHGNGWILNGHKKFISGGVMADFAIVPATTDHGVTLFIVDADTAGYEVQRDIPMITGYQIGGHAEITLTNCEVPDTAILGEVGLGLRYMQLRLEPARISHCMRFIGRADRALQLAQDYVTNRSSFGSQLAELQQIQAMIADSHIDLHAARLMTKHCAQRMDAGQDVRQESSMTKVFVSEAVGRVADRCVQMMGALGVSDDAVVSMIWREARPFRIYDGANELHRSTIAKRIFRQRQTAGNAKN
jgi:acyl-CoA dehydrogenase